MKWTHHSRLDIYGVSLVGWPPNIPAQNPSSLKLDQNKELLQLLKNGTMRFVKTLGLPGEEALASIPSSGVATSADEELDSLSWAIYDEDDLPPSGTVSYFVCISKLYSSLN